MRTFFLELNELCTFFLFAILSQFCLKIGVGRACLGALLDWRLSHVTCPELDGARCPRAAVCDVLRGIWMDEGEGLREGLGIRVINS